MPTRLTAGQLATLKAAIEAETATIELGTGTVAINAAPNTLDVNTEIANQFYNLPAATSYRVWRSDVTRADVYRSTVLAAESTSGADTTWSWQGYKAQAAPEQDAWKEMFMGGKCDFGLLTNRQGALDIFGTSGTSGANRVHIYNVARRLALAGEKVLSVAVTGSGVTANNGNNTGAARGSTTNPDALGYEGRLTGDDITAARNF